MGRNSGVSERWRYRLALWWHFCILVESYLHAISTGEDRARCDGDTLELAVVKGEQPCCGSGVLMPFAGSCCGLCLPDGDGL